MKGEKIVSGVEDLENIIIINATENNLKNVNVEIPLNSFTCVTRKYVREYVWTEVDG